MNTLNQEVPQVQREHLLEFVNLHELPKRAFEFTGLVAAKPLREKAVDLLLVGVKRQHLLPVPEIDRDLRLDFPIREDLGTPLAVESCDPVLELEDGPRHRLRRDRAGELRVRQNRPKRGPQDDNDHVSLRCERDLVLEVRGGAKGLSFPECRPQREVGGELAPQAVDNALRGSTFRAEVTRGREEDGDAALHLAAPSS